MSTTTLASAIASLVFSYKRIDMPDAGDPPARRIGWLVRSYMPSGAGIDYGTTIDLDRSTSDKLVFTALYHHMNHDGYYTHWSTYRVIAKASLVASLSVDVTGRGPTGLKDYLADTYREALESEGAWNAMAFAACGV